MGALSTLLPLWMALAGYESASAAGMTRRF